MLNDFKTFLQRGNVIELAVAVVIGTAFGKIVTSLVEDMVMPIVGVVLGAEPDFTLAYPCLLEDLCRLALRAFDDFFLAGLMRGFVAGVCDEPIGFALRLGEHLLTLFHDPT